LLKKSKNIINMNKIILKYLKILITQIILLLVLVSCDIDTNSNDISFNTQNSLSVIIISSDISIGSNKIKFAILNIEGNPIINQETKFKGFISPLEDPKSKNPISFKWEPWPNAGGVYQSIIDLNSSGYWKITVLYEEDKNLTGEAIIQVNETPQTPEVGKIPPKIHTKTISKELSLDSITSDIKPKSELYKSDFYNVLGTKPIVINFSTPSFCKSGSCSPIIENIKKLSEEFQENIEFIHVEIYDNLKEIKSSGNTNLGKISQPVKIWRLPSEPWTFLIDSSGKIVSKHEGYVEYENLRKIVSNLK
tara:strand:- start:2087 stop:3007 length:921 start_codon:yes stop_codon:yes gene_type:complete